MTYQLFLRGFDPKGIHMQLGWMILPDPVPPPKEEANEGSDLWFGTVGCNCPREGRLNWAMLSDGSETLASASIHDWGLGLGTLEITPGRWLQLRNFKVRRAWMPPGWKWPTNAAPDTVRLGGSVCSVCYYCGQVPCRCPKVWSRA